tara:strand:+ start:708 stop:1010 length:303 start_codon:yes stop_codon:yes gene_type:complete
MRSFKKGRKVKTRARLISAKKSYKKSYEKEWKLSKCKGLKAAQCRHRIKCKYAIGKKGSFCRSKASKRRLHKVGGKTSMRTTGLIPPGAGSATITPTPQY